MEIKNSVAELVIALAAKHGITAEMDRIDRLASTFTSLAGDDVKLDEIEILLVHLARKEIISQEELFSLVEKYLDESKPT
ncbi:hypothetical protein [Pseudomonas putida]|uniref:hypothetical protein n=1 Tax=Pseudomonas putida TaxID=303 RepID=UPI00216A1421|nr:hypothetical protein [Pseudomonas putida]MCS4061707.1 hypothetical protein [Pseudomonas putida]